MLYGYARRCFEDDERVKERASLRTASDRGQKEIQRPSDESISAGQRGISGSVRRGSNKGISFLKSGETRSIQARFDNLRDVAFEEYERSRSGKQDGFSSGKNASVSVDNSDTLKAPNGKPSNLTPEQWKQVRTPAFKEWFGDWENDPENASKVVDENGEPLVVWHSGTFGHNGNNIAKGIVHFGTHNAAIVRAKGLKAMKVDSIINLQKDGSWLNSENGKTYKTAEEAVEDYLGTTSAEDYVNNETYTMPIRWSQK